MKTITVVVPTYNEEGNIDDIIGRVTAVFEERLPQYEYEILFVDDGSTDGTQALIEKYGGENRRVKALFNASNAGYTRNIFFGMCQARGDCAVLLHADLQNPPEMIPQFVAQWEKGHKIVIGIKDKCNEGRVKVVCRAFYYALMARIAENGHVKNFTDFELIDREFIEFLRNFEDPFPYMRGIIQEFGDDIAQVHYIQDKRRRGKSHFNLARNYDFVMLGVTTCSKTPVRFITLSGAILFSLSVLFAAGVLISHFIPSGEWVFGLPDMAALVCLFGSFQIFAIGIVGEYVLFINKRTMKRPYVREKRRINLEEPEEPK